MEISGAWAQWRSSKGEVVSIPTPPEPKIKKTAQKHTTRKIEDQADSHQLYDTNRGRHKEIHSDNTGAEGTITDGVNKFLNWWI